MQRKATCLGYFLNPNRKHPCVGFRSIAKSRHLTPDCLSHRRKATSHDHVLGNHRCIGTSSTLPVVVENKKFLTQPATSVFAPDAVHAAKRLDVLHGSGVRRQGVAVPPFAKSNQRLIAQGASMLKFRRPRPL